MRRYLPDFPNRLKGMDFPTIEAAPGTIFAVDRTFRLSYLNPAWFTFAAANGGEPTISERFTLGTPLEDAMQNPLKDFYLTVFNRVLSTGREWQHDYECSSPDTYRVFHEQAYPLHDRNGVMVVNSLLLEHMHSDSELGSTPPEENNYRQANGVISECSHCRRFQRAAASKVWDWIRTPPGKISHTLCPICFDYYFKHHDTLPH